MVHQYNNLMFGWCGNDFDQYKPQMMVESLVIPVVKSVVLLVNPPCFMANLPHLMDLPSLFVQTPIDPNNGYG